MDDYLSKPVRMSDVKAVLERWGEQGAKSRELPEEELPKEFIEFKNSVLKRLNDLGIASSSAFIVELIDEFLKSAEALLAAGLKAFEDRDARKLHYAAHALKGSSSTFDLRTLAALASDIEGAAQNNELDNLGPKLEDLKQEIAHVRSQLLTLRERISRGLSL
jgi:HPt (histidine-containing phosphotransfer) domain-containing protein